MTRRGLPRIDASWTRGGWEVQSVHVPGSFRMLGIWAVSGLSIPVQVPLWTRLVGFHAALYLTLAVSVAGLLAGAALYARLARNLELGDDGPWEVGPAPQVWRSLEGSYLPRPDVMAAAVAAGRVRGQDEHQALAVELGVNLGVVEDDEAEDIEPEAVATGGAR